MTEPVMWCPKCGLLTYPDAERRADKSGLTAREWLHTQCPCEETMIDLIAERARLLRENAELRSEMELRYSQLNMLWQKEIDTGTYG